MMKETDSSVILEIHNDNDDKQDQTKEIPLQSKDEVDDAVKRSCQLSSGEISISSSSEEDMPHIALDIDKKSDVEENRSVSFAVKKGMMDIALLTANANQLRFLITYNTESRTFYISVGLIVLSLIIQVAVGIGLIFRRKMKMREKRGKSRKSNSYIVSGIFLVTVINILAASFTTTTAIETPLSLASGAAASVTVSNGPDAGNLATLPGASNLNAILSN